MQKTVSVPCISQRLEVVNGFPGEGCNTCPIGAQNPGIALGELACSVFNAQTRDKLTLALNREGFEAAVGELVLQKSPIVIAEVDLDGFKNVNDEFGHDRGDEILIEYAAHMKRYLRRNSDAIGRTRTDNGLYDSFARIGGDEFWIASQIAHNAPNTRREGSIFSTMAHIQRACGLFVAKQDEGLLTKTGFGISVGFAVMDPSDKKNYGNLPHYKAIADQRMYDDKKSRKAAR